MTVVEKCANIKMNSTINHLNTNDEAKSTTKKKSTHPSIHQVF